VPRSCADEHRSISRWVSAQRKQLKQFCNSSKIDYKDCNPEVKELERRYHLLDEVGFQFIIGKGKNIGKGKGKNAIRSNKKNIKM